MLQKKSIWFKDVLEYTAMRWLTAIVGGLFLLMGIPSLYEKILSNSNFDHNFKFAIAATGWGIILLFVAIRKEITHRQKTNIIQK